jgi:hypothetical protein
MNARTKRMIMVRMKVAKSELISRIPTFAKIAVNAANIADSTAHICHDAKMFFMLISS